MELHVICQHALNVCGAVWRRTWHPMSGKHKMGLHVICQHMLIARAAVSDAGFSTDEGIAIFLHSYISWNMALNEWEPHSMSGKHKMELHAMCQHTIIVRSAV